MLRTPDTVRTDFAVGDWHVQPACCRVSRGDRTIAVRPRVMELLVYLAQVPGQVVHKDTLLNDVWGTDAVSESALTRTVTELRQALGDSAENPWMLETIPKRGYRLIAPVSVTEVTQPPRIPRSISAKSPTYLLVLAALTALVMLAVLAASGLRRGRVVTTIGSGIAADAVRVWVLVVPFDNRTGDAMFDDVVEQALERELLDSGLLSVVPRPRVEDVLALMKKPADTRLDPALARELALRDGGIRAVLTGQITRLGSTYVLSTRVINPSDGRTRATISRGAANGSEFLPAVRRQALDVRKALGEAVAPVEDGHDVLAKVTTPSLKALQLYSKAAALLNGEVWRFHPKAGSRYASAEALLTDATSADPSFASAWLLLAHAISRQNRPATDYQPLAERALSLSAGVAALERHFIEGFTFSRRARVPEDLRDYDAAARGFEAVLQLAPDHYWTLLELVPIYRQLGRFNDAERVVVHAATVRPLSAGFAVDAARVHCAGATGNWHARPSLAHRRLQKKMPTTWLRFESTTSNGSVSRMRTRRGSTGIRLASWRQLVAPTVSGPEARACHGCSSWPTSTAGIGRYEDALGVAERLPDDWRAFVQDYFARQRERSKAQRNMVGAEMRELWQLNDRFMALVLAGKLTEAELLVAEQRRRGASYPLDAVLDRVGQMLVQQGHYAEGLAMLERIKPDPMGPRYFVVEHMAKAHRGLGDVPGAIREHERVGETRAEAITHDGWQVYSWLRCRVLLSELYREAGRGADAERTAQDVRMLLALSDPGHPLLARLSNVTAGAQRMDGMSVPSPAARQR